MKAKLQRVCLLALALAILGLINGCATTDYYRLKQTRMDVDFAMTRYQNRVAFGAISPSYQSQVTSAYQAYKSAFNTAIREAHSNYDAPTPGNVKQLADQLLYVLSAIPDAP